MPRPTTVLRRALVGRPRTTRELHHTLLPKWMALPIFSSDALSSNAYATQEMMVVLAIAGTGAFTRVIPLSIAVAALLVVVVSSYRQTVRAYPHGGGAYIVARENLGDAPGLIAAGALLIDYVLTVSVSVAAGVEAMTSATPFLHDHRVLVALSFIVLITVANLRGVKEAGLLFAIPTYLFVTAMFALIIFGAISCVGGCPQAPDTPGVQLTSTGTLTLFLLLRAFASGATALTGVEAISNGVPAFRYPQGRNAATTLGVMGLISVTIFLGISALAVGTGATVGEGVTRTVTASVALAIYGGTGVPFYVTQAFTALILILAANTAYADFPRLSSVLAHDRFLPRQMTARGDRLVFSNGIFALALASSLLLIAFQAEVTRLIQLYVVGVFTAFTLSQSGMIRHWLRTREVGWVRSALLNGLGAATTGVVLVVVAITKFTHGAWIVILAIPLLAWTMHRINLHYLGVSLELRSGMDTDVRMHGNHVVVLIDQVDEAAARAVSYAQTLAPASLQVLAVPAKDSNLEQRWASELSTSVPLRVLTPEGGGDPVEAIRAALREEQSRHPNAFTTALIAETLSHSWWDQLAHHRLALRVKSALMSEHNLVVADLTSPPGGTGPYTLEDPGEHHVVVLISGVHRASIRAVEYAQGLQASSIRALSVSLEPEHASRMLSAWEEWGVQVPLEIIDSPYRSLTESVREYVRDLHPDGRNIVVTCVIPEFILPRWYHQPLHNQTALIVKAALLFERGVVTVSVPFPLSLD